MTDADLALRVLVGTGCGVALGVERARAHKIVGVRTMGLLGLATALIVAVVSRTGGDQGAVSRVVQGLLTGVGFIGAGVILRGARHPHGLTTATAIWGCCIVGVVAGAGETAAAAFATLAMVVLLALGDRIDRRLGAGADKEAPPP